jgi:hypothetical protein
MGHGAFENAGAMPPNPGERAAPGVDEQFQRVASAEGIDVGAEDFKEDEPEDDVGGDFGGGGVVVVVAQVGEAFKKKEDGQRAGNEEDVVEVAVEEIVVHPQLEAPAIEGVKETTDQKEAIPQIAERFQRRARMTRPSETDNPIFRVRIMEAI